MVQRYTRSEVGCQVDKRRLVVNKYLQCAIKVAMATHDSTSNRVSCEVLISERCEEAEVV